MRKTLWIWVGLLSTLFAATANITSVENSRLTFFLNRDDGLTVGQKLSVLRQSRLVGIVEVESVGEYSSKAKVVWQKEGVTFDSSDVVSTKLFALPSTLQQQGGGNEGKEEKSGELPNLVPKKIVAPAPSLPSSSAKTASHELRACAVHLVVGEAVLIGCGKDVGWKNSQKVKIFHEGKRVAEVLLQQVGSYHSIGKVEGKGKLSWGDLVQAE